MRKTVAIVSDGLAFSELLADLVQQAGPQVVVLRSLADLTTFMRLCPVQLVVIDTALADGSGRSLIRAVRHDLSLSHPGFSVLAITRARSAFHGAIIAAGADEVMTKPVVASHFMRRVSHFTQSDNGPTTVEPVADNVVQLFAVRR